MQLLLFLFSSQGARGPAPALGEHEKDLVTWIYDCAKKGFPRRRENILDSVQEIIQELHLANPFTGDRPSDGWYREGFPETPS